MQGKGEICLQKAMRFGSKNGLKRAVLVVSQLAENQTLARLRLKRALVRDQKGVSWTSKGHLLQANWALIASQKSMCWICGVRKNVTKSPSPLPLPQGEGSR